MLQCCAHLHNWKVTACPMIGFLCKILIIHQRNVCFCYDGPIFWTFDSEGFLVYSSRKTKKNCNYFLANLIHSLRTSSNSSVNISLTSSSSQAERTFPPQAGLTYSGWVYLECTPTIPSIHSSVGLFTVEKQWEEFGSKRLINSSVFQLYLNLQDKSLVVRTPLTSVNFSFLFSSLFKVVLFTLLEAHIIERLIKTSFYITFLYR